MIIYAVCKKDNGSILNYFLNEALAEASINLTYSLVPQDRNHPIRGVTIKKIWVLDYVEHL